MSILLKDVTLYQNGEIHEHSNIVVDGKLIREFPKHPRNEDYDEVIDLSLIHISEPTRH